jgi:hypothetical protein
MLLSLPTRREIDVDNITDEQIEKIAVKHEAFGFGRVDVKGLTTHGFDPDGLAAFVRELLALQPSASAEQADALQKIAEFGEEQAAQPVAVPGLLPTDWLREDDLLYRMDEHGNNHDEIKVTMAGGRRDLDNRAEAARLLIAMFAASHAPTETQAEKPIAWWDGTTEDYRTAFSAYQTKIYTIALYAAPLTTQGDAGKLVPLTENQIIDMPEYWNVEQMSGLVTFARAIERAHGIGPEQEGGK